MFPEITKYMYWWHGGKVHIFLHSAPAFSWTDDIILSQFTPHFFRVLICHINGKTQFKPTLQLQANQEKRGDKTTTTTPPPPNPAILGLIDI